MDYKPVPVEAAKQIAEHYDKDMVVILSYDSVHEMTHTTTYGKTAFDKENAAAAGEICAKAIGSDLSRKQIFEDFHDDYSPAKLREALEENAKLREACQHALEVFQGTRYKAGVPQKLMTVLGQ
jgi:hypothetical protein